MSDHSSNIWPSTPFQSYPCPKLDPAGSLPSPAPWLPTPTTKIEEYRAASERRISRVLSIFAKFHQLLFLTITLSSESYLRYHIKLRLGQALPPLWLQDKQKTFEKPLILEGLRQTRLCQPFWLLFVETEDPDFQSYTIWPLTLHRHPMR